ncbi:MAG TPA: N-acetylmuramoyl-L-alanine amidase [Steroidobacteraceae bacterium]|nr:N-acetylmuramoyl-L-alanine amidase [Steroidobacteraceae bacterium]
MSGESTAVRRGSWLLAMAFGVVVPAFSAGAVRAATDVRAIHLSTEASGATVTIELSQRTRYQLFTLERPYRVVLDFSDTRGVRAAHLPRAAGMVEAVRAGVRPRGSWRLVLELKAHAPAHAHWASVDPGAKPRLVIAVGTEATAAATTVAPRAPPVVPGVRAPPVPVVHTPIMVHAPIDSGRDVVVAVDAGHGGQDSGAIGHGGTEEKNVVLAIARALAGRIDAEPGMRAVLTRDRDEFLPLRERMRRARAAKADLFVSIHADSVRDRHVSGSSVYVLSERGATDEAARWLAERENAADLMGGVSLADKDSRLASVLLDLSQSANISASMTAAQRVLAALKRVEDVRKPQVQQAGFVVLKAPDVPSMLIETAYISNPSDERRLRNSDEQQKLAEAIFSGLRSYFELYPPAGTRFARDREPAPASAVLAGAAGASLAP